MMILRDRYWLVWAALLCSMAWAADEELPKRPPGSYFGLSAQTHADAETFRPDQPIVGTSYFYWYDIDSKSHIIDHDGTDALTTHPADMNGISYSSNPQVGQFEGAFRPVEGVKIGKSGAWKTMTFKLEQCRFMNRCNGVDFRLPILGGELTVSKVRLERPLLR